MEEQLKRDPSAEDHAKRLEDISNKIYEFHLLLDILENLHRVLEESHRQTERFTP